MFGKKEQTKKIIPACLPQQWVWNFALKEISLTIQIELLAEQGGY